MTHHYEIYCTTQFPVLQNWMIASDNKALIQAKRYRN